MNQDLVRKNNRVAIKAISLALMEFKRIAYQKKADPKVIEALTLALNFFKEQETAKVFEEKADKEL